MPRAGEDKSSPHVLRRLKTYQKVDFPNLSHFQEELSDEHIHLVRLDMFEEPQQSELSFVYYVTLIMYVTAQDPTGMVLYEYRELLETTASSEPKFTDEMALKRAHERLTEVGLQLSSKGFVVQRGRFSVPD
jgi:hypothetical protein